MMTRFPRYVMTADDELINLDHVVRVRSKMSHHGPGGVEIFEVRADLAHGMSSVVLVRGVEGQAAAIEWIVANLTDINQQLAVANIVERATHFLTGSPGSTT